MVTGRPCCWITSLYVLARPYMSLNERPRKAFSFSVAFAAARIFSSVANACASLIGKVGALFIEKSWRVGVAARTPAGTSTANESARISRLESANTLDAAFAKRTTAPYTPGFAKMPRARRSTIAESLTVRARSKTSKVARTHTPLAWVPRASGRFCLAADIAWMARIPFTISAMSTSSVGSFSSKFVSIT